MRPETTCCSTEATRERLGGEFELQSRGEREFKGIERPVRLYAPPRAEGGLQRDAVEAVRSVYARVRGSRTED